jgi:hypothetical protein
MISYDGDHRWPAVDEMELALLWLLQESLLQQHFSDLFRKFKSRVDLNIDTLPLIYAYMDLRQLRKIKNLEKEADSYIKKIEGKPAFQEERKRYNESIVEEEMYMQLYTSMYIKATNFESIDSVIKEDWTHVIGNLKRMQNADDVYLKFAATRCLDNSIRLCFERIAPFLNTKQFEKAYNLAHVASFFLPDNGKANYLMAVAASGMMKKNLARKHIKNAVKYGFSKEAILTDRFFQKLFTANELTLFLK